MSELRLRGRLLVVLAYGAVLVPFLVALVQVAAARNKVITLPDDLALIELHTRRAAHFAQQLGVFDYNGWNHPGPSYFYLQAGVASFFSRGANALFFGALCCNAAAAVACLAVVQRRRGPMQVAWTALLVCWLCFLLADSSPSASTYSETVLGALVSPWNPMVVILPLLLVLLLAASSFDRSVLAWIGLLIVGSYCVQTDIATTPLVGVLALVGPGAWVVTWGWNRWRRARMTGESGDETAKGVPQLRVSLLAPLSRRGWALACGGVAVLVAMWTPPFIQQATTHPGNLTLLWRFFTAGHPGQPFTCALWATASAFGVVVYGPAEVMRSILGTAPAHAPVTVVITVATLVVIGVAGLRAWRFRDRFALGLSVAALAGVVAAVLGFLRIIGFIFGYLTLWAVVIPVCALLALAVASDERRVSPPALPALAVDAARPEVGVDRPRQSPLVVVFVSLATVVASVLLLVRVIDEPSITAASDPVVGRLAAMVRPALAPRSVVFVGDSGAGSASTQLIDSERFIGLVNQLDLHGYHPKVNAFWRAQFGPGYLSDGKEGQVILLVTWSPEVTRQAGYLGRAADMGVLVVPGPPPTL